MIELNRFTDAPEKGTYFISFRDKVELKRYNAEDKDQIKDLINQKEKSFLELHMFDADIEYRAIRKRSGVEEFVISDPKDALVYEETILTDESFSKEVSKVSLINYLDFDNDLIKITNYRLKEI